MFCVPQGRACTATMMVSCWPTPRTVASTSSAATGPPAPSPAPAPWYSTPSSRYATGQRPHHALPTSSYQPSKSYNQNNNNKFKKYPSCQLSKSYDHNNNTEIFLKNTQAVNQVSHTTIIIGTKKYKKYSICQPSKPYNQNNNFVLF